MTTARELLAATDLLLLDFDGPVTKLLPPPSNAALTDTVRAMALDLGVHLNADEMTTTDHLAIIRAAHRSGSTVLVPVEDEATRLEVAAAEISPLTPGVVDLLTAAMLNDTSVIIITNNSPACATRFLEVHDLHKFVQLVIGRDPDHILRMKPNAWMIETATRNHKLQNTTMLGDSVSDIIAANSAGISSIGLAKSEARKSDLIANGATATVSSLNELTL